MGTTGKVLSPVGNAVPCEAHDAEHQLHDSDSTVDHHPDGDLGLETALVKVEATCMGGGSTHILGGGAHTYWEVEHTHTGRWSTHILGGGAHTYWEGEHTHTGRGSTHILGGRGSTHILGGVAHTYWEG